MKCSSSTSLRIVHTPATGIHQVFAIIVDVTVCVQRASLRQVSRSCTVELAHHAMGTQPEIPAFDQIGLRRRPECICLSRAAFADMQRSFDILDL
jgi:hypothetical protein